MITGLSSIDAEKFLKQYGPNEITEKHIGEFRKFVRLLVSPISLMLLAASALSFYSQRQFDGSFILALLVLNVGVTLWHGHKTDRVLEALRSQLSVQAKVLRDGVWKNIPSRELAFGDVIQCRVGTLIPADVRIDESINLEIK